MSQFSVQPQLFITPGRAAVAHYLDTLERLLAAMGRNSQSIATNQHELSHGTGALENREPTSA